MARDTSTWHRLSDVDRDARTATCSKCGLTRIFITGGREGNSPACAGKPSHSRQYQREQYAKHAAKRRAEVRLRRRPHLAFRGDVCELCGFVPEAECQLTVHHKDCDHDNNDGGNLVTLCANCHWLQNAGMLDAKLAAAGLL